MPQIWLTYEELAAFVGREADDVQALLAASDRPRRKCSDGQVRVKLGESMAHDFMLSYASAVRGDVDATFLVSQLRGVLTLLRRPTAHAVSKRRRA
jgi:hypothetical protein